MVRIRRLCQSALIASLTMSACHVARADVLLPKELFKLLPDLYDMTKAAITLTTNDVPMIVGDDVSLTAYAERVEKVHFGHEFPNEPAIDGKRVFAADPEERAAARKEYADFVAAEAKDIERVKARREDRVAASRLYEQIAERAGKYSNRAPDLIDAAGKRPDWSYSMTPLDRPD